MTGVVAAAIGCGATVVLTLATVPLLLLGVFGYQWARIRSLRRLSERDALTGVLNRRGWLKLINRRPPRRSDDSDTFVCVVDLVGLKQANSAGHAVGDALLVCAAGTLSSVAGGKHVVARLGGDEFGVLIRTSTRRTPANLATRVEAALTAEQVDAVAGAARSAGRPLVLAWAEADEAMTAERRRRKIERQ